MRLWELILIAMGLSMDAFAMAVCKGLSSLRAGLRHSLIVGAYFGLFQALMPLTGYFLGAGCSGMITSVDHWIAFLLLTVIGGKMLLDTRREPDSLDDSFRLAAMLPLAMATSVDALAMGVGFAFLQVNILFAVSTIGLITFVLSALGVRLGALLGARFHFWAEWTGGLILILMGFKILLEHIYAVP